MPPQSHMAAGSYACHIHHGGRNDIPREGLMETTQCYGLFGVFSGQAILRRQGEHEHHAAPCAFVLPPGGGVRIECPAASRWEYLSFDVVPVPLRPASRRNVRSHQRRAQQPSPEQVWGGSLPVLVSAAFLQACLETLRFCGRLWWMNEYDWARANARLHWWLTEFACDYLHGADRGRRQSDPWLAQVNDIALSGIESGMTAKDLARALGISREQLRLRLATTVKMTPGAFLVQMRMQRAQELMAGRKHKLANIARLTGYRSLPAFSAAFKKYMGCSPGAWQRQLDVGHS